jgi:hypothetical protein
MAAKRHKKTTTGCAVAVEWMKPNSNDEQAQYDKAFR